VHCNHRSKNRVWAENVSGVLKLHPYCENCGTLKNVSSLKGKKLGHFMKVVSELKKSCRITEVQLRLIAKELESNPDFQDLWWINYEQQKKIFVEVVTRYVRVNRQVVESLL